MPGLDAIIIGAGHNGLICAAYLARAGLRVLVLERRPIPGGCTATEEVAPGFRINRCHCDHLFLYTTPIPRELELERHGLQNLEIDPCYWAPSLDDEGLVFWKDVDRTADAIGRRSPRDARSYRAFVRRWGEVFQWLQPIFLGSPRAWAVTRRMLRHPARALLGSRHVPLLARAQRASASQLLEATFEDRLLKGVLAFHIAGLPGVSPSAPGSAAFGFGAVLHHLVGMRRPRGGSGGLVRALVGAIEAHGGLVRAGTPVQKICVEARSARAVCLADGEQIEARIIVAACDPQTTFLKLLEAESVPPKIRHGIERLEIANGYAMKVDYLIDRLPEWRPHSLARSGDQTRATAYVSPSIGALEAAYRDYERMENPRQPALIVSTPTAADVDLAPSGSHLLTVETRYTPYRLGGGRTWQSAREEVGDQLFRIVQQYAPNLAGAQRQRCVQTPEDLERDLGLPRGQLLHIDPTAAQSLGRRPIPALADYRTPIRGLYLTGAGTHPSGGVWGAPGHNAAQEILADLG